MPFVHRQNLLTLPASAALWVCCCQQATCCPGLTSALMYCYSHHAQIADGGQTGLTVLNRAEKDIEPIS
ncbi:hypothetical protein HaLaN_14328 [Haematococcus lacustris]|uniref:Secreted protein n=1 Tax=Haematococcus lacustris TaxID=44745 RepID=A0A699Z896_HAELA|nr:hypothetical protein HaLaN_14328 [Haematococcus lacustris]